MAAGSGPRRARAHGALAALSPPRSEALATFVWSRAAIWAAAVLAFTLFEPNRHPRAARWDVPELHDLGWLADLWARWDSAWFVRIAESGYATDPDRAPAFFPLYPGLVAALGRALGGHYVAAGILVSLAACLAAFVLLERLAGGLLGDAAAAGRAVLYLALFPMTLFLQAVYSESLYLALALAAFLLAERGRWGWAAGACGLALLSRPSAVALLPALALLAWRSPARRRALAWLAASPAAFAAYPLLLHRQVGDAWAFAGAQDEWHRHLSAAGPLGGAWDGARAAWAGLRQLAAGPGGTVYWPIPDADPTHAAAVNVSAFVFLVVFAALTVVAWRRLGAPYGLFAVLTLAIPLSVPSSRWPLLSLPRFALTAFPCFLALALLGARPRAHAAIAGTSAVLLGVTVTQWALWQWVA